MRLPRRLTKRCLRTTRTCNAKGASRLSVNVCWLDRGHVPFTVVKRELDRKGVETNRWQAKVLRYGINSPDNTAERYHIKWPPGAFVADNIQRKHFTIPTRSDP